MMRERMQTVVWAWREVVRRNRGEWGGSSRVHAEGGDGPEWLLPDVKIVEWTARGGVSAIPPGTMGAWLNMYARATAGERIRERRGYAAWRARSEGGKNLWKKYMGWVRRGARAVRPGGLEQWMEKCDLTRQREIGGDTEHGTAVTVTKKHGRDIVEGGDARTRRRVARCIGGWSADHTDVREAKPVVAAAAKKVVMWRRERVRADGLEEMRRRIHEAREGKVRVEVDGYVGRATQDVSEEGATRRVDGWLDEDEGGQEVRYQTGWLDEDEEEAIMSGIGGGEAEEWRPEEWEEDMARAYGEYEEEGEPFGDG